MSDVLPLEAAYLASCSALITRLPMRTHNPLLFHADFCKYVQCVAELLMI